MPVIVGVGEAKSPIVLLIVPVQSPAFVTVTKYVPLVAEIVADDTPPVHAYALYAILVPRVVVPPKQTLLAPVIVGVGLMTSATVADAVLVQLKAFDTVTV